MADVSVALDLEGAMDGDLDLVEDPQVGTCDLSTKPRSSSGIAPFGEASTVRDYCGFPERIVDLVAVLTCADELAPFDHAGKVLEDAAEVGDGARCICADLHRSPLGGCEIVFGH